MESSLADHGVRKYDYETGRFISCDALWGKYLGWSPYMYSLNNPIAFVDFNGLEVTIINMLKTEREVDRWNGTLQRFINTEGISQVMWAQLNSLPGNYEIVITDHGKSRVVNSQNKMFINIYQPMLEDEDASLEVLLGHELGHMLMEKLGLSEKGSNLNGVPCNEVNNINIYENPLRMQFFDINEIPIRHYYSGKEVNDSYDRGTPTDDIPPTPEIYI